MGTNWAKEILEIECQIKELLDKNETSILLEEKIRTIFFQKGLRGMEWRLKIRVIWLANGDEINKKKIVIMQNILKIPF